MYRSTLAACAVLLFAGPAFADPPPSALHPHVEEYMRKFQLPKRVVKVSTPGVNATRTFVPVITDEHHADFQDRFSKRNGAIAIQLHENKIYPTIRFDAKTNFWRDYTAHPVAAAAAPATPAAPAAPGAAPIVAPVAPQMSSEWTITAKDTAGPGGGLGKPIRYIAAELDAPHIEGLPAWRLQVSLSRMGGPIQGSFLSYRASPN